MVQPNKETTFDFSKESRKEPNKVDWSKIIQPTLSFTKRHKQWFMLGIGIFLAFQGLNYVFSDSPQEIKTKTIALQTAAENIPVMIQDIEKSKNSYDELVNYIAQKEYDIPTNSMKTMQEHGKYLNDLNVSFKKFVNEQEASLQIIEKKIKETKTFELLTSDERKFLLNAYTT